MGERNGDDQLKNENIKELVDRILADSFITREEQATLNKAILEDDKVSPDEIAQIDRIMALVKEGKIRAEK